MFLSYFEWNEAKEGSVFYILYQYIIFIPDIRSSADQARSDTQFSNKHLSPVWPVKLQGRQV